MIQLCCLLAFILPKVSRTVDYPLPVVSVYIYFDVVVAQPVNVERKGKINRMKA